MSDVSIGRRKLKKSWFRKGTREKLIIMFDKQAGEVRLMASL